MGAYAKILKGEARRLVRDEGGVALMLTLGVFLFLFLACCGVYAVGETISRRVDLQNACDAGAHAAAVAQADALSRMAVVNRAMSWNYVQMTKMQLDYITYNWLKVTCNKFAADKKECLKHDSPWDILHPSNKSGWTFVPDLLGGFCQEPYTTVLITSWWNLWYITWPKSWIVLNCKHNTHNRGDNRISNYIGMRSGHETKAEEIYINGHKEDMCLHFRDCGLRRGMPQEEVFYEKDADGNDVVKRRQKLYGGDFDYVVDGKAEQESILAEIEGRYGDYGCPDLSDMIDHMKAQIGMCNSLLIGLNASLTNDIRNAATEAIRQSLPRTGETENGIVTDGLDDYYCLVFGGVSSAPREYGTGDEAVAGNDGSRQYRSFFSGLRNNEQDEMLFLNMADGLPNGAGVTLAEYFLDDQTALSGDVIVPGLDQWFVRCSPEESQYDGRGEAPTGRADGCGGNVCMLRDLGSNGGITRCYKNANYHDLRTQVLPKDIHRGNYCFDGVENIVNDVSTALGNTIGQIFNSIPLVGQYIGQAVSKFTSGMIGSVLSGITGGILGDSIVEPSCINRRSTFPDMCSAVPESVGLVAEYEWAAAYWVCWYEERGWWPFGSVKQCWHLPLAIGAAHGGATDNGYNPGPFLGFLNDLFRNFYKSPKGHSREDYRSDCMFIDGEKWRVPGCGCESLQNGRSANVGIKSYARVYGDDRDAFDKNYYGATAMPWLLNEDFFNGSGTIVVGLARKNRNAFEALLGAIEEKTNIFSLFTPLKGSHLVAFSAGRAAYAPRTGTGRADGPDSFNEGGGTRYDLHYDATAKNLEPHLPSGGLFDSEWRRQKAQLEKASYGCVCTEDGNTSEPSKMAKTRERLRRQWNLCQTDWDGVLLPLRFARAPIAEWFANQSGVSTASALNDKAPEWAPGPNGESAMELSQILMRVNKADPEDPMLWHRLDGGGTATLEDLLHQGGAPDLIEWKFDETGFGRLIWARRIL